MRICRLALVAGVGIFLEGCADTDPTKKNARAASDSASLQKGDEFDSGYTEDSAATQSDSITVKKRKASRVKSHKTATSSQKSESTDTQEEESQSEEEDSRPKSPGTVLRGAYSTEWPSEYRSFFMRLANLPWEFTHVLLAGHEPFRDPSLQEALKVPKGYNSFHQPLIGDSCAGYRGERIVFAFDGGYHYFVDLVYKPADSQAATGPCDLNALTWGDKQSFQAYLEGFDRKRVAEKFEIDIRVLLPNGSAIHAIRAGKLRVNTFRNTIYHLVTYIASKS